MYSEKKCVINTPVRPVGMNFEVRGPKVIIDCDVLKRAGGPPLPAFLMVRP